MIIIKIVKLDAHKKISHMNKSQTLKSSASETVRLDESCAKRSSPKHFNSTDAVRRL